MDAQPHKRIWTFQTTVAFMLAMGAFAVQTGCQSAPKKMTVDQQIAAEMERYQKEANAKSERLEAAQAELRQRLNTIGSELDATEERLAELQATVADWDISAMQASIAVNEDGLAKLRGDHVGLQYRTTRQFDELALIHANLEQTNEDLRKQIAGSVASVERRGEEARGQLRDQFNERLEEDRSIVLSEFRTLEQQVAGDASRAALAMQLIREALAQEQSAIQNYAKQLDVALSKIDTQFGPEGRQEAAIEAAAVFEEATRLHREFLGQRYRAELLDSAVLAYRRGLALQPDRADMHFELGKLLRIANRADEAVPHLRYYLKNGSDPQRQEQVRMWLEN